MDTVKMRGFIKLTRVDDALEQFFSRIHVERLPLENTSLVGALGRILAENVVAEVNVPSFDRSAVDGYALRAEGTYGASRSNPQVFEILGAVKVGVSPKLNLKKQQAARIATGALMPGGADSIVMIEYTEKIDENRVEVYSAVTPGENVSKRGEDVQKGETILSGGHLLRPQDLGILAALGYNRVKVVRRPKVAILSTGDELVEFGKDVRLGEIIDSNRPTLMAMIKEL
ncbi:MAG: molybdopterin molybdotransferase MoeA, partial [Candidatus Hermodarchaeota archaeon]